MKTIEVHTIESLYNSDKESDNRKVILVNDLKHAKIIVEIKGGVLQAVYITPALKSIPVVLLDYDNVESREEQAGIPNTASVLTEEELLAETEIEQGKLKSIF